MGINQTLLNEIKKEMIYSGEDSIEEYYGVSISVYKDLDKYLERVPNIYDKIILSQWANNYEKANELISSVQINEEQQRKYSRLLLNNADLNETIDFRILTAKYDFLDDMLDIIVANRDVQEQIISLSDEKLEIFKILYNKLSKLVEYRVPHLTIILNKMGTITPFSYYQNQFYKYIELEKSISNYIKEGKKLSEEELNNLLYLYTTNLVWDVKTIEELNNFTLPGGIFFKSIDQIIENQEQASTKDINAIKNALLLKAFGINLSSAKSICGRYDLNSIKINNDNADLFEMYRVMIEIINEKDPELLITVYKEFSKKMNPKPNFMRIVVFENALRKEFALTLNSAAYKCGGNAKIIEDARIYDAGNTEILEGVRMYDAGTDFKMIVTAIGAYQIDFGPQENYKEYWNQPAIRSHGNCCSLIGNNNLSMANPKNVIFGFSTMNENMLLLSSSQDINSTPLSKRFNIAKEEMNDNNVTIEGKVVNLINLNDSNIKFSSPEILLDNTRGDYNELVYERRDLSSNPLLYKKNPDYIVFIEEYEDIDYYLSHYKNDPEILSFLEKQKQLQEHQFQESKKAARDFGIPIVKINREKCARISNSYIKKLLQQFEITKNPNLISDIICEFENNRVGNNDHHKLIREKYFSKKTISEILAKIENIISLIEDSNEKDKLLNQYYNSILNERKKVEKCEIYRKNGQTSGIDFDVVIERITTIANSNLEVDKLSEISLPIRR